MTEIELIMFADKGFYPVRCLLPNGYTPEDAAKAHGRLNNHVNRVEDKYGKVLWVRTLQ